MRTPLSKNKYTQNKYTDDERLLKNENYSRAFCFQGKQPNKQHDQHLRLADAQVVLVYPFGICARDMSTKPANIAVIGAGWWSQGWHLPHLARNERSSLIAIIEKMPHPSSSLNAHLETISALATKYSCPVYGSIDEFLADDEVASITNGIIICTPHSTHFSLGKRCIEEGIRRVDCGGKPLNILMEKPFTTCVEEAKILHKFAKRLEDAGGAFLVNHSANFREQTKVAREAVQSGKLGRIRLVSALMASPLSWLFNNPKNKGWNAPDGNMVGNGFAWGQSSHILAWIYHVADGINPNTVYCTMNHSDSTGADVAHSATIDCDDDVTFSLSGTSLLPGYEHSDPPVGKKISVHIIGTEGTLSYVGKDKDPTSGRLELSKGNGSSTVLCQQFHFEDVEGSGTGPESVQEFILACQGSTAAYMGANSRVGLKSIQTIDAMYRSNVSRKPEAVL